MRLPVAALAAVVALTGCASGAQAPAPAAPTDEAAHRSGQAAPLQVKEFDSTSPQAWSATFQVLSSDRGTIMVDPGKYDEEVAKYVASVGGLDPILLTHGHWDKLRGLDAALAANPRAVAYIHELDQPCLHDPVRNCSIEDGFEGRTDAKTTTFTEGKLQVARYTIEAIHLPGHTEGSTVFHLADENVLIGGDTIMKDLVGSARHPGGNADSRRATIARIKTLSFPPDMRLYHGHGGATTYAEMLKANVDLR